MSVCVCTHVLRFLDCDPHDVWDGLHTELLHGLTGLLLAAVLLSSLAGLGGHSILLSGQLLLHDLRGLEILQRNANGELPRSTHPLRCAVRGTRHMPPRHQAPCFTHRHLVISVRITGISLVHDLGNWFRCDAHGVLVGLQEVWRNRRLEAFFVLRG